MVEILIDIRRLEGFHIYGILLPSYRQESQDLILQFPNFARLLDYQKNLLSSLKLIRNDATFYLDLGKQHKMRFIEKILVEMMNKANSLILGMAKLG